MRIKEMVQEITGIILVGNDRSKSGLLGKVTVYEVSKEPGLSFKIEVTEKMAILKANKTLVGDYSTYEESRSSILHLDTCPDEVLKDILTEWFDWFSGAKQNDKKDN